MQVSTSKKSQGKNSKRNAGIVHSLQPQLELRFSADVQLCLGLETFQKCLVVIGHDPVSPCCKL